MNLLFKDAVDTMCFVCLAVTFRPSRTILYNIFNVVFFAEVKKNCQKHFGLYDDGLITHNKCCTISVLFFVFGDVMLSIIAAISPSYKSQMTIEFLRLLNFALPLSFCLLRPFSCPGYDFIVFWYSEA